MKPKKTANSKRVVKYASGLLGMVLGLVNKSKENLPIQIPVLKKNNILLKKMQRNNINTEFTNIQEVITCFKVAVNNSSHVKKHLCS